MKKEWAGVQVAQTSVWASAHSFVGVHARVAIDS
jgi:hypothetical protein